MWYRSADMNANKEFEKPKANMKYCHLGKCHSTPRCSLKFEARTFTSSTSILIIAEGGNPFSSSGRDHPGHSHPIQATRTVIYRNRKLTFQVIPPLPDNNPHRAVQMKVGLNLTTVRYPRNALDLSHWQN
jgi:hypothetical protein